jgi:hypothetical protein
LESCLLRLGDIFISSKPETRKKLVNIYCALRGPLAAKSNS